MRGKKQLKTKSTHIGFNGTSTKYNFQLISNFHDKLMRSKVRSPGQVQARKNSVLLATELQKHPTTHFCSKYTIYPYPV